MSAGLPPPSFGPARPNGADIPGDLVVALSLGRSQPVGGFRLDLATGRWTWAEEIFRMHGFLPGEIVPSTALLVAHKHPDDRQRVSDVMQRAGLTGVPFSCVHRIIDAQGNIRVLGITGQGRKDGDGQVIELVGYFVDLSESQREAVDRDATEHIAAGTAGRASIEQAKGILMAGLHVTDDEAFAILRRRSNDTNVPLRDLARAFVDVTREGAEGQTDEFAVTLGNLDTALANLTGGPAVVGDGGPAVVGDGAEEDHHG